MQRFLLKLSVTLMAAVVSVFTLHAQDTIPPTSVDPKLIEWQNARIPKEYTIANVNISGIKHLDTSIVYSIANLQTGDKFMHPGEDIFAKAITNLWRQKLFSNIEVYVTKIEGDKVWVDINVLERPRLGSFKFIGIKKSEEEDIQGKVNLAKQTIITENTRRDIIEKVTKYYTEKSYRNVKVRIEEKPDPAFANSNSMTIYIEKGDKVRIDN
ncbi:MAG: POTRA domain-containing protein, partial [Bacteroidota bacterium]